MERGFEIFKLNFRLQVKRRSEINVQVVFLPPMFYIMMIAGKQVKNAMPSRGGERRTHKRKNKMCLQSIVVFEANAETRESCQSALNVIKNI